jgi:acylphosphatase
MKENACKIRVEGIVQGVGYRFFTQDKAREYGLKGYVKNAYDGSVEVYAEGETNILNRFIEDLKQGPRMARVEGVDVQWLDAEKEYESFTISF